MPAPLSCLRSGLLSQRGRLFAVQPLLPRLAVEWPSQEVLDELQRQSEIEPTAEQLDRLYRQAEAEPTPERLEELRRQSEIR